MNKYVFKLPLSFTGCDTKDEPHFPRQNNLILKRRLGCEFPEDFSRPNKEISSTFQGPKPNLRTF